jgi:urocanate hydratase
MLVFNEKYWGIISGKAYFDFLQSHQALFRKNQMEGQRPFLPYRWQALSSASSDIGAKSSKLRKNFSKMNAFAEKISEIIERFKSE